MISSTLLKDNRTVIPVLLRKLNLISRYVARMIISTTFIISVKMWFDIETKDRNVVPIFPPKHFVDTRPRVGEQGGTEDDHSGSTVRRCVREHQ